MDYQPALHQAISLAALLIDFEIEQPQVQPAPVDWLDDLRQARSELTRLHQQFESERAKTISARPKPRKPGRVTNRFERKDKIERELRGEV